MTTPIQEVLHPPIKPLDYIEKIDRKLEAYAAKNNITSAVTSIALVVFGIVFGTAFTATSWLGTFGMFAALAVTNAFAQQLMLATFKMSFHKFWESVVLPRKKENLSQTNFSLQQYTPRKITQGENTVASLVYDKGKSYPVVTLQSDFESNGRSLALLLAPQIHYLFHAVYKPILQQYPNIEEEAETVALPKMYQAELWGMAEGLKEYEDKYGLPVAEIDQKTLKCINVAMGRFMISQTRNHKNAIQHIHNMPSKGLLSKFAFEQTHLYQTQENTIKKVQFVTYPAMIGATAAWNTSGVFAACSTSTEQQDTNQKIASFILPRFLAESCESAEQAKKQLQKFPDTYAKDVAVVDKEQSFVFDPLHKKIKPLSKEKVQGSLQTSFALELTQGNNPKWHRDYYVAHQKMSQ